MNALILLKVLFELWGATLGPTEFKIVTYLYYTAAASPDRKVSKSIEEIAKATGLAWRTVQAKLHDLDARGVIKVVSQNKERTLIQIPLQHWCSPVKGSEPDGNGKPPSIPELIYRLCGQRTSPEILELMRDAAGQDEQRLQHCLDSLFRQGKRFTTLELVTVAVQHDLRPRGYFDQYWSRP